MLRTKMLRGSAKEKWQDVDGFTYKSAVNVNTLSGGLNVSPISMRMAEDGETMLCLDSNEYIYEYDMSTGWDITSMSYTQAKNAAQVGTVISIACKYDGTKVVMNIDATAGNDDIGLYTLSTGWNISTAGTFGNGQEMQSGAMGSMTFKQDGLKFWTPDTGNLDRIKEYVLSTAWTPSSSDYGTEVLDINNNEDIKDIFLKPDGLRMYLLVDNGATFYVRQYTLSTAWDLSTASYETQVSVGTDTLKSFFMHPDGNDFYVLNSTDDSLERWGI